MKFIKQKLDTGSCGPVALYNALLWLGRKPKVKEIYNEVKCDKRLGTATGRITTYLKSHKVAFSFVRKTSSKRLKKALQDGHGVIYLYQVPKCFAHFVFMFFAYGNYIITANEANKVQGITMHAGDIVKMVDSKYYAKCASASNILRRHYNVVYPKMWIIKRYKHKLRKVKHV